MSARRRQARSIQPDRATAQATPSTLFGYPVQIVDERPATTKVLIAEKVRMGLIRADVDLLDLLILSGAPDVVADSPSFKIYRPEAN